MEVAPTTRHLHHGSPIEIRFERDWSHSPKEWAKIRPRLQQLYITQHLSLKETMAKIAEEYGFFAR